MVPTAPTPNLDLIPGRNLGPTPTVGHAGTTAGLAPAQGHIGDDLAVGPTVESVDAEATVAHPCPIAAGTSATVQIQIPTVAWECLA